MYIGNGAIIQIHLKDKQQFHRKSQTKQQRCDAKNTFNFVPQTRADDASAIRVRGCTVAHNVYDQIFRCSLFIM